MKEDRVEFRTSHQEREQFEVAASFLGMNLSSFLRMAALERSVEVLKKTQMMVLSNNDRDIFMSALEKPLKPNKNLKKALSEYKKLE